MRVVRSGVRRTVAELTRVRPLLAAALAAGTLFLIAATPDPEPTPTPALPDLPALTPQQMQQLVPKKALHTEILVKTNKLGQVTGAKAVKLSGDHTFNIQTYGNALQAFIRTEDGKAVPGVYKLTYDYDPKSQQISRNVALVKRGGVDPNAEGAALVMMSAAKKEAAAAAARAKHAHPSPAPTHHP
jgi:hypothetical protein